MSQKPKKSSETIGVRSKELHKRIRDLIDANPGKVNLSDFVRAAVEEKLDRVARGEDPGIRLESPKR